MSIMVFQDLNDSIYDDLVAFCEDINREADRIDDMLNDALEKATGFLEWVVPGTSDFERNVRRAVQKWTEEIWPEFLEVWGQLQEEVWKAVGDLAGRPGDLLEYAGAFADVKAKIYVAGDMNQKLAYLDIHWSGDGYSNYRAAATTQDTALMNLSMAMDAGSTLTSNAANEIWNQWRSLAKEFLGWTADLLGCFEKATEADSIISFEVPALFDLAQGIWQAVIDVADLLAQYMIQQATTAATSWQQLSNGSRGLPQNLWPAVEENTSDTVNDPGNWGPK